MDARAIAEETARSSYGRLIAFLAARTRNIAAAEDALADAFAAALESWPRTGPPASPEAWLLTAARRRLIDAGRRDRTREAAAPTIALAFEEAEAMTQEDRFVDERLKLLFICAHPAIDPSIRTPLMLQTVLGLTADRIASAFLVAPAAMGQRLVRAKTKIAAARIPFDPPPPEDLPARAEAVLDAIYAAFAAGVDASPGFSGDDASLAGEARYLAGLTARLLPEIAEAHGLNALVLHVAARRRARRDGDRYVPLADQDISLWDRSMIDAAETALERAARLGATGRFQIEAAIQSAHVAERLGGVSAQEAILRFYDRLVAIAPSIGAEIGRAAALLRAGRPEAAIAALDAIDAARIIAHQPYWATRAHALAALGDPGAEAAFERAIGLAADPAVRRFLAAARAEARRGANADA